MPPRSSARSGLLGQIGRRGLSALAAGLSPVENHAELARACREDPEGVHRELVRVVSFSAFHLLAQARGLVAPGEGDTLVARMARELAPRFTLDAALVDAVRRALSENEGERLDYATLEIEELGSVYEGMLA